jgi:hypothetical protein
MRATRQLRQLDSEAALRHSEHAHLLSDIEKLTLPILGSLFPFGSPTGDLVCRLEPTSTKDSLSVVRCLFPSITGNVLRRQPRRRARGPRAPLARLTWAGIRSKGPGSGPAAVLAD